MLMSPQDKTKKVKGVVCYCHGYGDQCGYTKRAALYKLVEAGYVVAAMDYEGHGRSDGELVLVEDWSVLIGDVVDYFGAVKEDRGGEEKFFLMGESMGGAVCFDGWNAAPDLFDGGCVMVAPMVKIADEMKPPQFVVEGMRKMLELLPWMGRWCLTPSGDLSNLAFKDKAKLKIAENTPALYGRVPRLATGREMVGVTERIEKQLGDFAAPFLVCHGEADKVTSPEMSKMLYDTSCSGDKSLKMYKGMWHTLLTGEPDENIEQVLGDVIEWLDMRT
ncbi:hypothetical protein ScalyP_jg2865 [Parmales sp. scaly parma]|nr:hypothetical protein ScalyP_jg2865 [Parmales sp. scaly parma]